MSIYEDRVLPHVINLACSAKPNQKQREKIVPLAEGEVLEVGFGSGLNLPFYDALAALDGMRRVLKPGGSLLFCEHGIAPDENVRRWQRRLNPAWNRIAGGCDMDRDIPDLLATSGFEMTVDERMYIPGIKILCYNYWGTAKAVR